MIRVVVSRVAVVLAGMMLLCGACRPATTHTLPSARADYWPTFEQLTARMEGQRMEGDNFKAIDGPGTMVTYHTTERTISFIWKPNAETLADGDYLAACQRNRAAFFSGLFPNWEGANSAFSFMTTALRQNVQVPYNHLIVDVAPGDRLMLVVRWIESPLP